MDYNSFNKKELGFYGESLALDHLKKAGLKIVAQNYRCPKGEIDIVALDENWLVIIEVRTKSSERKGTAEESINHKKIQRLRNIAAYYLLEHRYRQWPLMRFDVIGVHLAGEKPEINWIKGAF